MKKGKAIFVTVLMTVMLAAILFFLHLHNEKIFTVLLLILGGYGFLCAAGSFCKWLSQDTTLEPAHLAGGFNEDL